jgi:hypothetical protein
MLDRLEVVTMCDMGMVTCLFMISVGIMLGRFSVMVSGIFIMSCRVLMFLCSLMMFVFWHKDEGVKLVLILKIPVIKDLISSSITRSQLCQQLIEARIFAKRIEPAFQFKVSVICKLGRRFYKNS